MRFPCPHCGSRSHIRSTNRMSPLTGILRCRCNNDDCGFVFQVGVEVTGYFVASATPNPAINLQSSMAWVATGNRGELQGCRPHPLNHPPLQGG